MNDMTDEYFFAMKVALVGLFVWLGYHAVQGVL